MATAGHSKATRIYFDGYRVSQVTQSGDMQVGADTAESSCLEDAAKTYLSGKVGATVSLNGIMDVAAAGWDLLESGYVLDGTIHHVSICPQGNTAAYPAYVLQVESTGDSRAFDQANVCMLNYTGQCTGKMGRGQVLTTGEKTFTEDASDTGDNVGATTTQTMMVMLHVIAYTGLDSAKFQIDESQNDGDPDAYAQITGLTIDCNGLCTDTTDDVTFTGLGSALLTKTGATEAYKRITADVTGTGSVTVLATYCQVPRALDSH